MGINVFLPQFRWLHVHGLKVYLQGFVQKCSKVLPVLLYVV